MLSAEARTVRDQGSDSPRPSVEVGSLPDEPDGPRLEAGRSVRAQERRSSSATSGSRSWEGSRQGDVLGLV
jgi:hypothetical protein